MIKLILNILVRAIKVGISIDKTLMQDFECLPDNYIIKINILPKNISVCFRCMGGKILKVLQEPDKVDLLVEFKDQKSAVNCLLGKTSLASAFCEHRIKIYGNINNAMALTRIVNSIECYLYPKFIYGKLFNPTPKLEASKFKFYLTFLFGGNLWNTLNFLVQ